MRGLDLRSDYKFENHLTRSSMDHSTRFRFQILHNYGGVLEGLCTRTIFRSDNLPLMLLLPNYQTPRPNDTYNGKSIACCLVDGLRYCLNVGPFTAFVDPAYCLIRGIACCLVVGPLTASLKVPPTAFPVQKMMPEQRCDEFLPLYRC